MFQPYSLRATEPRRGVILMVVLILLTLFAIVGLSFALYASSEAQSSQLYREAEMPPLPDADPEILFAYFMGQYLYDTDDFSGIYSALRGHSLGRTMYGYNYKRAGNDSAFVSPNTVPFNGLGRLHGQSPFSGLDEYSLVNYTCFLKPDGTPVDGIHDPERSGWRPNLATPPGEYAGGFNAPYTYPDLNNMFLAAVKADGTVLMPSFHRPWLFGPLNPGNPNWMSPQGKYLTLRPRPVDMTPPGMTPRFPYPEDEGGDVKNLVGSPGYSDPLSRPPGRLCNNDSIWIDLGYPVLTSPDGRKYKPLFAPLIIDLDNRINVNVHGNIRGNARGAGKTKQTIHVSNQGWGPWEVSLSQVLNGDPQVQEWTNLFEGLKDPNQLAQSLPLQRGRYGILDENNQLSSPRPHAPWVPNMALLPRTPSPFYSPVDFDAAGGLLQPSHAITLPAADGTFTCFPRVPSDYQGNSQTGLLGERKDHPSLYNYFQPTADDRRRFLSNNMEALLRYNDTGSLALTSELLRLCPVNFASSFGSYRRRNLVTTHSFDIDRPGVMPWATPGTYKLQPGDLFPNSTAPNPIAVAPQINKGEYGPDGRAGDAFYGRLNLNRDLPPYPDIRKAEDQPLFTNGRLDLDNKQAVAKFTLAQSARVQLAKEIFDRLRFVTTGETRDIASVVTPKNPPEFNAMRWLAQVAVNIVDYIDSDDYMTPFNWYPPYAGHPIGEWVYGTELPHLVLNEAYIEYDNDPADTGAKPSMPFWVNFWVELYNPFNRDPNFPDSVAPKDSTLLSAARLRMPNSGAKPAYGIYQLQIAKIPNPSLQSPDNTQGFPDSTQVVRMVSDFTSADPNQPSTITDVVLASDPTQYGGQQGKNINGFYVMGPANYTFPGAPANQQFETLKVRDSGTGPTPNSMTYKLPAGPAGILSSVQLKQLPAYGLFLQRLACPHLPPNPPAGSPPNTPPDPTIGPYNPYITIDYLDSVQAYDGASHTSDEGPHTPLLFTQRFSWGRKQPYAAHKSEQMPQKVNPVLPNQPQNTFFRHNGEKNPFAAPSQTLAYPFDWLIHLDRPLISPMELLNVSAYKPHELTQRFASGQVIAGIQGGPTDKRFQHRLGLVVANQQSRIYRVFELLETGNGALGTAPGGRVPGKINPNTMWDPEPLAAICDPQPANSFTATPQFNAQTFVKTLFAQISQSRTPSGAFSANDKPFRPMAAPYSTGTAIGDKQYPAGIGINDTLLRASPAASPAVLPPGLLFGVPQTANQHPFLQYELLNKIYNHLTTRSNVFAVWLTVGFFEVLQDTDAQGNPIRPVKLGAEIGKAENRNIRHRMFAIVDRTNLSTLANVARLRKDIFAGPQSQTVQLDFPGQTIGPPGASIVGTTSSPPFPVSWSIKPGSALTIEDPANPETVLVTNVDVANKQIMATFKSSHPRLTWVSLADTPGPPPIFIPSLPLDAFKGVTDTGNPTDVPILATFTNTPPTGPALTGTYEDLPWSIRPGDWLVVDSGPNEETVQVLGVSQTYPNPAPSDPAPPSFQARFTKLHAGPLMIRFPNARPGNPGPQPRFNPRDPTAAPIVRYFSIIE